MSVGGIIGLAVFIVICWLYYLVMKAFFGYVAPDALFIGSMILSFAAPTIYAKVCHKVFDKRQFSRAPLIVVDYLIFSMHLNFVAIAAYWIIPEISGALRTAPEVTMLLQEILRYLPDQNAIALLMGHVQRILPLPPFVEFHLLSVVVKSLVMGPLLILAKGAQSSLVAGSSQPAYRQYFFYGSFHDLGLVVRGFAEKVLAALGLGLIAVRWTFTNAVLLLTWPLGIVGFLMLLPPLIFSILIVVGMLLFHSMTVVYIVAAIFLAAVILRLGELLVMWARWGFAKCPHCYRRISSPVFQCPSCGAKHTNLVPGLYGLLLRQCSCGEAKLPTLFALGKARRLTSYCPHEQCEKQLSAGVFARNIHIPFAGGPTAGKTSLMAANLMQLLQGQCKGLKAELIDEEDRRSFADVWKPNFEAGIASAKTADLAPPALLLSIGQKQPGACTLYVYDPAGEAFEETDPLLKHSYLQYASGTILIVDPFSMESVREKIGHEMEGADFDYSRQSPTAVFEQLVRALVARAGLNRQRASSLPLAVVIPKIDAFRLYQDMHLPITEESVDDWSQAGAKESQRIRAWLNKQDSNLVRLIEGQFTHVRYFAVTAFGVHHESGKPFRPIRTLQPFRWLLAGRRRMLKHPSAVAIRLAQAILLLVVVGFLTIPPVQLGRVAADSLLGSQGTVLAALENSTGLLWEHLLSRAEKAREERPDPTASMPQLRVRVAKANIRSGPGTNFKKIGSFVRGTTVRQVEKRGAWIRIWNQRNVSAWIREDLLSRLTPVNAAPSAGARFRIVVRSARVRTRPTTSSSVVTGLPRGTVVTKIGQQQNWYKILTPSGQTGWIRQDLARATN